MKEYIHTTSFRPGEMVFNKGDSGDCLYEVLDGSIGIYLNYGKEDEKLLAVKSPGEFFGEIALIEVVPRTAAAVALETDTTLRIVGVKGLMPYLRQRPDAMEKILYTMAERIKQGRKLYLETCGVVSQYKDTISKGETPDAELSEKIAKCLDAFEKYQKKYEAGT